MNRETIIERITLIFVDQLNIVVPSIETDLMEIGALDSLSFVDLLLRLETDFGLTVPLADLDPEQFRSIAKIAAYVHSRLKMSWSQVARAA